MVLWQDSWQDLAGYSPLWGSVYLFESRTLAHFLINSVYSIVSLTDYGTDYWGLSVVIAASSARHVKVH